MTPDSLPLRQLKGGSSSQSGGSSTTYDYSGLDSHIKRQDALDQMRGSKFAALYGGDIAASTEAGNKIRHLLKTLRPNAPGTTEREAGQITSPLVRIASTSSRDSSDSSGPTVTFADPNQPADPTKKPAPKPGDVGIVVRPNNFAIA